ncbi:hypothetical protein [Rhodobacter aestuarii]|nr:hypothetical protein [Rhodobacter aestuarii]
MEKNLDLNLKILRNAAFLRREFVGLEITRATDGGIFDRRKKTIFIYDTDVIVTYCEPWKKGPLSPEAGGEGYGEILSVSSDGNKSERERAMDVAAILAERALLSMRDRNIPAFLFDGHLDETNKVYAEIGRRVSERSDRPQLDFEEERNRRLRQLFAMINYRAPSSKQTPTQLSPLVKELFATMNAATRYPGEQEKDEAALRNLFELRVKTGNIYPTSKAAVMLGDKVPEAVRDALCVFSAAKGNPEGFTDKLEYLTDVERQDLYTITQHLSRSFRAGQEADWNAISLVYLANARLKTTGWRVVLMTGTTSLVNACHGHFAAIKGLDPKRAEGLQKNFASRFIRHLWSGTTDALLEPASDNLGGNAPDRFINWLDGFIADCSNADRFEVERLDEFISDPKRMFKDNLERRVGDASNHWKSLIEDALRNYRFRQIGIDSEAALKLQSKILYRISMARGLSSPPSFSEMLREHQEEYERERDLTYTKLSDIGIESILSSRGIGLRNPPDLAFESLKRTNKIFKTLCSMNGYSDHNTRLREFADDYQEIWRDTRDEKETDDPRKECYLRFLALGAAFASGNLWGVALSQGERALAIVRRSKSRGAIPDKICQDGRVTHISGREAYFLCATAQRAVARTQKEFDRSFRHLKDAERCLEEDWKSGSALSTSRLRLKGEHLALQLSRYYDARKRAEKEGREDCYCDDQVADVFSSAKDLLEYFKHIESNGTGFGKDGKYYFPRCKLAKRPPVSEKFFDEWQPKEIMLYPSYGKVSLLHISTNFVQVAAIRSYRAYMGHGSTDESPLTYENLRFAVELMSYFTGKADKILLDKVPPPEHLLRASPLVLLYRETGALLIDSDADPIMKNRDGVDRYFEEHKKDFKVADYDDWRLRALRTHCERLVTMSADERRQFLYV